MMNGKAKKEGEEQKELHAENLQGMWHEIQGCTQQAELQFFMLCQIYKGRVRLQAFLLEEFGEEEKIRWK